MGLRFIFMLTRSDRTVENAANLLKTALKAGIRHIGFKDVGLPFESLRALRDEIKAGGATSYLEVVSLGRESEISSARAAVEIGVDILLGGTHADDVLPVLNGSGVLYYPFAGAISGHPSVLTGSIDEIVKSARELTSRSGVNGLDLLAYRSAEDTPKLMKAVCEATGKPVIIAGSIDSPERIAAVKAAGAAGFTIGTAALDGFYPAAGTDLSSQLAAIMKDVARLNNHISPYPKKNLSQAFGGFSDIWSPKIAGQINDMQIKLAKFQGESLWHYHPKEDELYFIHRGRLLMKFRDREEIVEEGEFIIVRRGVEHCPAALDGVCEVVLVEPGTTVSANKPEAEPAGIGN